MTARTLVTFCLVLLAGTGTTTVDAQPNDVSTQAAQDAAREWLALIDERDFEDGWEDAAPAFRARTDRSDWIQRGTRLVDSIGPASSRTLTDVQHRDSLREDTGPAVVLTYRTAIGNRSFEETLVVVRPEEDWHVAGYRVTSLTIGQPETRAP